MDIREKRKLRKIPTAELFTPVPDYITTILRGVGQVMFRSLLQHGQHYYYKAD